ncbi:hypothetical protein Q9R29_02555 [Rothia sp. ARF10]|nr:hypothetical protein [Rothia sp. ARF10]
MTDPRIVPTDTLGPAGAPPYAVGVGAPGSAGPSGAASAAGHDPLRLCIFATVALLGWLLGPLALAFFAGLGVVGYAKARRAGLLRSKCLLGDTRLVLAYLAALVLLAVAALVVGFGPWRLW